MKDLMVLLVVIAFFATYMWLNYLNLKRGAKIEQKEVVK